MKISALFSLFLISISAFAQTASVKGSVKDANGNPIESVNVALKGTTIGTTTNHAGEFELKNIQPGNYTLVFLFIGYKQEEKTIQLKSGETLIVNTTLQASEHELGEVEITGKTETQEVREQAFTVTSIDVKPLQNLNLDVNTVLNRTTGVRIRQDGGLGSDFNFSLNGFSGNQVRFFIDGISSDYLGAAMQFNNIPVNVIERIEIYKGVVPVNLGADALGGAVNIVTNNDAKDFIDASYSFGSFNTHQASLASRVTFKNRFVLNASGFFNYSDNNFPVDAPVVDKTTGKIDDPKPYKLFNENYLSGSAIVEGGVVNAKWADRFLIGIIASGNEHHYQRGRALVLNPMGLVYTTDKAFTPTLKYQKKNLFVRNLSLNLAAIYSYTRAMSVDTSSRIYNWDGTYTVRSFGSTSGEASWYKTMFRFNDHANYTTATLEYVLAKRHTFTLNNTYSYFWRQGEDPVASEYSVGIAFSDPNTLSKNITGFSYKLGLWENRWNTTVFAKLFYMNAQVSLRDDDSGEYYSNRNKQLEQGGGMATSLFATKDLLLKASYEFTSRLPENYELFGDGLLLLPNMELKPERSHNMNIGLLYSKRFKKHSVSAEGGFLYRLPKDFIRLVSVGILGQYQNLTTARVMGAEAAITYGYKQWFTIELNATYQDMLNANKTINTYPDPLYLDRIPNIPYLYGNAILGFISPEFSKHKFQIGFNWTTTYVEEFYLNWPSQGASDTKYVIPRQIAHDAAVSFSALSGRYNIAFTCANLADSKLYDNYKVQKPGRGCYVKFRVYLDKFRK